MTCLTALITPFDREGAIDEKGFRQNIRFQKKEGADGLVVLGTTGEAPTLSNEEKECLIEIAKEESDDLPVIVGCGAASTAETIENLTLADDLDVDGALIVVPYYNKPSQEGIFRHFDTISKVSAIPIIIYNNPARAGVNIEPETLKRLAKLKNIIGLKESSGNLDQTQEIIAQNPKFTLFSGDDSLTLPRMGLGAGGVISTASNVVPSLMKALVQACSEGRFSDARKLHYRLLPLFKAMNWETNPIPIKAAMNLRGFAAGDPRLPLTPLPTRQHSQLKKILSKLCE